MHIVGNLHLRDLLETLEDDHDLELIPIGHHGGDSCEAVLLLSLVLTDTVFSPFLATEWAVH